jgi:hypothetical protein
MESINYLLDAWDCVYVLHFSKTEAHPLDKNLFCGCVKTMIQKKRISEDGETDNREIDSTPIIMLKTDLTKMQCDLEVLASPGTTSEKISSCQQIAYAGPKEFMTRIMPLYVKSLNSDLKYTGMVFRFANNQAFESDELFVAHEIEFLVSLFFPEHAPKK